MQTRDVNEARSSRGRGRECETEDNSYEAKASNIIHAFQRNILIHSNVKIQK